MSGTKEPSGSRRDPQSFEIHDQATSDDGQDFGLIVGGLRLPLPLIGTIVFGGIRLLSLAEAGLLLGPGRFGAGHWSLARWITSWDAKFYLILAARGYGYRWPHARPLPRGTLYPWFPGYPAAIRSIAWLPGISLGAAGFIVTIAAGLAAACGLTVLALRLTGNPRVSLLLVGLWAAVPGSAVFVLLYPEPLYCALAIWALVALTRRRWLTAALLTIAAGAVQSEAIALIAAVAAAAFTTLITAVRAGQPAAAWWRPLAAVALAPLGLAGYLAFVAIRVHRIDGWFWIESAAWYQSFDWGKGVVQNAAHAFLGQSNLANTLLTMVIVLVVPLTAWTLASRLPLWLTIYTIVAVALPLGASETWFSSKLRFLLPAILLTLPLARALTRLRTPVLIPLVGAFAIATTWIGLYLSVTANLPP